MSISIMLICELIISGGKTWQEKDLYYSASTRRRWSWSWTSVQSSQCHLLLLTNRDIYTRHTSHFQLSYLANTQHDIGICIPQSRTQGSPLFTENYYQNWKQMISLMEDIIGFWVFLRDCQITIIGIFVIKYIDM